MSEPCAGAAAKHEDVGKRDMADRVPGRRVRRIRQVWRRRFGMAVLLQFALLTAVPAANAAQAAASGFPWPDLGSLVGSQQSSGLSKQAAYALHGAPTLAARPPGMPHAAKAVSGSKTSAAASQEAKAAGKPVDVPQLTTDRSTTVANPDGSFTTTESFSPVRMKAGGGWAPIDTTLARTANGDWAPKAAVASITLSGGGTGPLATVSSGAKSLSLTWPLGALPTRVLGAVVQWCTSAPVHGACVRLWRRAAFACTHPWVV